MNMKCASCNSSVFCSSWLYFSILIFVIEEIKGPLSGLRQFLTIERSLKIMKNAFYFMFKALFVLEIFTFLSSLFGINIEKRLDKKAMVDYKVYDVTYRTTNNCNTHITQYLKKQRQSCNEVWSVNKIQSDKWNLKSSSVFWNIMFSSRLLDRP